MRELQLVGEPNRELQQLTTEQSNQLLIVQKNILELIITNSDYQHALDSLCRAAENMLPNSASSIMLFNNDKTKLEVRAAPNISSDAVKQLSGLEPGENAGSCGTAVFKQKPQYISDTSADERWANLRAFAQNFNIQACWSMPIINQMNEVVGSFAISSFEKRSPSEFQQLFLQVGASLVSLVLLREADDLKMQQAAYFDTLTQLPNRVLFNMRAEQAIARADRSNKVIAILFVDLDEFKQVNDQYGHEGGDKVLRQIADHMLLRIRKEDTLARFGGDEFVLLVEGISDKVELEAIATKLLSDFEHTINVNESNLVISASIGISLYPEDGT
jgi:diguanylate cyclase (GGDEF)-like protein